MTERLNHHQVLLLLTHTGRPTGHLSGLGEDVELGPFDRDGVKRLLRYLLEAKDVGSSVVELACRSCEGNPLYVEEMAKYLVQEGLVAVVDGIATLTGAPNGPALPDSIAGLIAARIDALDASSKGALQLAATIGVNLQLPLLGQAMGVDDPTPLVTDLSSHGLIRRLDGEQWTFASELVREAALRSILGVQRRNYHRLIAEALEALHADDLESVAESLAVHCAAAGRLVDAARHYFVAGKRMEEAQYLGRARTLYEQGLVEVIRIPEAPGTWDARVQGEAMLNYRSGAVSRLLGEDARAERSLHVALDISSDAGLPWIEVRAHLELGRVYMSRGKLTMASAHIGQAKALAVYEDDPDLRMETLEAAANLAYEQGDNDEAETLWRKALEFGVDNPGATARCQLGMASRHIRDGDLASAAGLLQMALAAARGAGDRILVGRVLNNMGLLHYWRGASTRRWRPSATPCTCARASATPRAW